MSVGSSPFSPGTGYFVPDEPGVLGTDLYKITLTRRCDGSLQWNPEKGSVALINALNINYPEDSTIKQKMQMAVMKKLEEEAAENKMYGLNSPGMQSTVLQRPSFSSGTTLNTLSAPSPAFPDPAPQKAIPPPSADKNPRPRLAQSAGAGRISKPSRQEGRQSVFPSVEGAPMTKGRKGPLSEKQKADAKRNRKEKSVCKEHRKLRTKAAESLPL